MNSLELLTSVGQDLYRTTGEYYTAGRPHPYLEGLAGGGLIHHDPAEDTAELARYRIVEATGFRDTFLAENYPIIGIPEDVAGNGLMWCLMTDDKSYHKDFRRPGGVRESQKVERAFAYWDGTKWTTARQTDDTDPDNWEGKWQTEESPSDTEVAAIQTVVRQTNAMHLIHAEYGLAYGQFHRDLQANADPETSEFFKAGISSPLNYLAAADNPYMHYYLTAYQQGDRFLSTIDKLVTGQSFQIDSDGVMASTYHAGSLPVTADIIEGGVNIVFNGQHPPVPQDWLLA